MCSNFEREYQTVAELQWHELNIFLKQTYMFSWAVLVSWTPLGASLQRRIQCTTAMTEAEYKPTKYALMQELCNVFCEDFRENWLHYNSTALYLALYLIIFTRHRYIVYFVSSKSDLFSLSLFCDIPDSKVHGANMGSIWGQQAPGGPHVGPMNFLFGIVTVHSQYVAFLQITHERHP